MQTVGVELNRTTTVGRLMSEGRLKRILAAEEYGPNVTVPVTPVYALEEVKDQYRGMCENVREVAGVDWKIRKHQKISGDITHSHTFTKTHAHTGSHKSTYIHPLTYTHAPTCVHVNTLTHSFTHTHTNMIDMYNA